MPVYNGGAYFGQALDSALAQDYPNIEIVVVNDGSTDNGHTERIASSRGPRVRYISQANGGVASALNTALAHATGDYFAWLSHDDVYLSNKTSAQIRFLESIGRPDACLFSDYDLIGPDDDLLSTVRIPVERIRWAPKLPLFNGMINGCSLLIPMAHMQKYGPFDESLRYVQDYDLWQRILCDHEFFHQPEVLIRYRIHPGQDTHKPQVVGELDPIWVRFIDSLSPTAHANLFGSSRRWYEGMSRFIGHSPAKEAAGHATAQAASVVDMTCVTVLLVAGEPSRTMASVSSVLAQIGVELQLVVVLPKGLDEHAELDALASLDSRITLWRSSENLEAEACNEALLRLKGEYVAFLSAGDLLAAPKLRIQMERMATQGAFVSHTSYVAIDDPVAGRPTIARVPSGTFSGDLTDRQLSGPPMQGGTIMLHRAVVDAGFAFGPEERIANAGSSWRALAARYLCLGIDDALTVIHWSQREKCALQDEGPDDLALGPMDNYGRNKHPCKEFL